MDYWNSFDKKEKIGPDIGRIGTATFVVKDQLQELKSKVFEGATHVELTFMGKGKGSRGQGSSTPESYGKEEREAMRELATINEVELTTHASVQAGNLAGLGDRGFEDQAREQTLHEVKKAIDFAADVSKKGGPVTVHTGEFPRPIYEAEEKFAAYEKEKEERTHYLVDEHTGQIIKRVRQNETIHEPEKARDEQGNIIYQRNPDGSIREIGGRKQPEYQIDKKTGNIKIKKVDFNEFKESDEFKEILKSKENTEKMSGLGYNAKQAYIEGQAAKEFFRKQRWGEYEHSIGQANEYEATYRRSLKERDKLREQYEDYQKASESGKKKIIKMLQAEHRLAWDLAPKEGFEDAFKDTEKRISYGREVAVSARKQAAGIKQEIERSQTIEEFGVKKTADSLARAGMHAYDREKKMKLKDPLYISPENMFPEQYGSHPRELKKLVVQARKQMVKKLKEKKDISESQAKKIAADHIKATFDIGHAYTWKKYFKGKDKDFDKWIVKEAGKLQKEGILGHVHITDNFGYDDEHLSPGDGSVPIKEFVKEIEKQGFKGKMIIEPGGQPEGQAWRATTSAWKTLNSPIYRVDSQQEAWSDIESSYFGRTGSPSYLVGDTAPSKDWAFWTETPIE